MLLESLFWVYIIALLFLVVTKFRSRDFFESLPSLFWGLTILIPFWIQKDSFAPDHINVQGFSLLGVALTLIIGDAIQGRRFAIVESSPNPGLPILSQSLFILVGGAQVIHLGFLQEQNQIIQWIINGSLKSNFAPLFDDTYLFLNIGLLVASPLALSVMLKAKRINLAICFYLVTIFYSLNLSTERAVLNALLGLFLFGLELTHYFSRKVWLLFGVIIISPILVYYSLLSVKGLGALNAQVSPQAVERFQERDLYKKNGIQELSLGDRYRILRMTEDYKKVSRMAQILNVAFYETFLLPAESSQRWYQYFPAINGQKAEYSSVRESLGLRMELQGPHNQVGIWAYARRFPSQYNELTYSRASIDAEAQAHGGTIELVFTLLGLLFLRLAIKFFMVRSPWGESLNCCCLTVFALALPHASILALLFHYGIMFFIVVMMLHYSYCKKFMQEDYIPSHRHF